MIIGTESESQIIGLCDYCLIKSKLSYDEKGTRLNGYHSCSLRVEFFGVCVKGKRTQKVHKNS